MALRQRRIDNRRQQRDPSTVIPLLPEVDFPEDPALPEFLKLFDSQWVWDSCQHSFKDHRVHPCQIRMRQFSHIPGRSAKMSYEAKWRDDDYIPPEIFTISLGRGQPTALFKYPQDDSLPGLVQAADPTSALRLVNRHVMTIPRGRMGVEMVRYRSGSRAVLRHRAGRFRFYARVVRLETMPGLLKAAQILEQSGFVSPPIVGSWAAGGTLWMPEVPGTNLRDALRHGEAPDPTVLLEGLESLWSLPYDPDSVRPFNLRGVYRRAERTFRHALREDDDARRLLDEIVGTLGPFIKSRQARTIAHNDFYDDQMIVMPDGRVALVDFEEVGLGDPMLDVGNFLAHLRWAADTEHRREPDVRGQYHRQFQQAALDRFGWKPQDLALSEAVCVFRICTNTIRRLKPDWHNKAVSR